MWGCPVCKTQQADKNAQCAVCGYDVSTDMERYPTLICVQKMMLSNAAKAKAYAAKQNSVLHPKVPVDWVDEAEKTVQEFEVRERVLLKYHGEKAVVTLPLGIREIGREVFAGNVKLERVVIPESVEVIGSSAFRGCGKLSVVELRTRGLSGLHEIAPNAFSNCERLSYIQLPETLKKIGHHSFINCTELTKIAIPGGVRCLDEGAFKNCSHLRRVELASGVQELGESAFEGCERLETVQLPSTLKKIGGYAFAECLELQTAQLPEGLVEVGDWAFGFCRKLAIKKPASLKAEGKKAYGGCRSVMEAGALSETRIVAESVESEDVFETPSMQPVMPMEFKETMKTAKAKNVASGICGKNLIWNLDENGLLEIEGTGEMQNYAPFFSSVPWKAYRNKIWRVVIKPGVASIGTAAFLECKNIQSVQISDTVTEIENFAFSKCKKLNEVKLPEKLQRVNVGTFCLCSNLTRVELPEQLKAIEKSAFQGCASLKELRCPNTLERIGDSAFAECESMQTIWIPVKTTIIRPNAFKNCTARIVRE